ncbi:MAG: RT0821/Lpp0805 family surface protein [Rickettsiales bacterium]
MNKLFIIFVLLFASSCNGNKQQFGTVVGGATGALIGSSFGKGTGRLVGVGLGAIAGGLIGNQIGQYMDDQDKMKMKQASYTALENSKSGQTTEWNNPDSGHSGTITPVKTYEESGRYCREYTQTVNIGGKTHEAYGTACRQDDGSWEIIK